MTEAFTILQPNRGVRVLLRSIVPMLLGIGAVGIFFYASTPTTWIEAKTITIARGDSAGSIANHLSEEGIIRSPELFRLLLRVGGKAESLKSGSYVLDPMSSWQLMARLVEGPGSIRITIPEGLSAEAIVEKLSQQGLPVRIEEFKKHEGYLFPETYEIPRDASSQLIIDMLRSEFEQIWKATVLWATRKNTQEEIVTMASILERESAGDSDRAIISGILWKRLDKGMRLQVDATLAYERGETSATLTVEDLEQDSPYNTYRRSGLPPTPIGNPGAKALAAAARPEESPYWYYLHDKEGNTYYARTLNEHVANKRKYLTQ